MPGWADAERETGGERCRAGEKEDAPVRRDVELDRKSQRSAPLADEPQQADRERASGGPAEHGDPMRLGEQLTHDPAAPRERRIGRPRLRSAMRAASRLARFARPASSTSAASSIPPPAKARACR